jgi:hypothetical protein
MDPTVVTGADTIHPNLKKNVVPVIEYSEPAKEYINFRRQRMIAARDARDSIRDEFDGMPFLKYYDVLKKHDDQYITPRKNKQDTAINTGTIRDKDTSLVEYAMKYDFEPVAQVFDENDDMLEELAETSEDLVRKSKLMEGYRDKAKLIYRSMVAFGVAMVEDAYIERWTIEKQLGKGAKIGSADATWTEKKVKTYDGCQAKLWDLRKCYFGDIRKFFLNGTEGQPYFFTVEYVSYDVAQAFFGDWERWKYVPQTVVLTPELQASTTYTPAWTLRPISANYCELVRYYDPIANEYAFTINGIDMLPIMDKRVALKNEVGEEIPESVKHLISGFPLTAVSPSGAIPFAKFDLEPMHDFVYSKSQPGKMRVWGDVENMFVKLMISWFKQSVKPTMGNKSGRNFGEEIHDPATVINDIREGDLFPVLPNYKGPEASAFSMFDLVQRQLSKNSVEDSFQGVDGSDPNKKTATQDMNEMKSQSLKVASLFDGIMSGENQLNWLRTYNIAANWTKPIDSRVDPMRKTIVMKYRSVTMPTEVDGGQKATKRIVFTEDTYMDSQDVHQKEIDEMEEKGGGELRLAYLNPKMYAALKAQWFYTCVPVPNSTDPLAYMLFAKQIVDAQTFFGPQSLNVKKLKHRFAKITGNDFDTWFLTEQELQQKQQEAAMAEAEALAGGTPDSKTLGGDMTMGNTMQQKAPVLAMK